MIHPWDLGGNNTQKIISQYGTTGLGAAYLFWADHGDCTDPACVATEIGALQQYFLDNTRLGIPISMVMETLHGGATQGTIFPMPCALGPTMNTTLINQVSRFR
jgi:hypothetical protein